LDKFWFMSHQIYQDLSGGIFATVTSPEDIFNLDFVTQVKTFLAIDKVRILSDYYNSQEVETALNSLSKDPSSIIQNLKIIPYSTNFFAVQRKDLEHNIFASSELDWENYRQDFVVLKVEKENQQMMTILSNFLTTSFAVDHNKKSPTFGQIKEQRKQSILSRLAENMNNKFMQTFLILTRSGELVGCFSLTNVLNECQLTGVTGLCTLPNNYSGKKLGVLCGAIVNEYYTNEFFSAAESLTFSNSKKPVANLYSNLGFEKNKNRTGWILEIQD
jgi:hypothetical protein